MRSAEQCIIKAVELEAMASCCAGEAMRNKFELVASQWRLVAIMARKQDRFVTLLPGGQI
jgi:hypothetical protein